MSYIDWHCPECGKTERTPLLGPRATRMHVCPKLHGLTAPMLRAGIKARIFTREREDYVGSERVQLDDRRRPVMSIVTERADGSNDCIVLAPTATSNARS